MARHLMIDIETLGTRPKSVILSVGYAVFDDTGILEADYHTLSVDDQLAAGRVTDESTVEWWAKQSEEAQKLATAPHKPLTVHELGDKLQTAYKGCKTIWGKGPSFDLSLLGSLLGSPFWKFWEERDVRTIIDIGRKMHLREPEFEGVPHNPKDDAAHQTRIVLNVWKEL